MRRAKSVRVKKGIERKVKEKEKEREEGGKGERLREESGNLSGKWILTGGGCRILITFAE